MAIKTKLEEIAALWRYILLMRPTPIITLDPTNIPWKDIQHYDVYEDYADRRPSSEPRLPDGTPDDLVEALIVWNYCYLTSFMVTKVLERTLDRTKFELGSMHFSARARFRFDGAKPRHTAITMTNTEDGKMYVVDLTLQQYGWPRENWLLPIPEYYASYVKLTKRDKKAAPPGPSGRRVVFDLDLEKEGQFQVTREWYFARIQELLEAYDWESWSGGDVLAELRQQIDDISHEAAER